MAISNPTDLTDAAVPAEGSDSPTPSDTSDKGARDPKTIDDKSACAPEGATEAVYADPATLEGVEVCAVAVQSSVGQVMAKTGSVPPAATGGSAGPALAKTGGENGNGNSRKKRTPSGELAAIKDPIEAGKEAMLPPTPDVREAQALLERKHNIHVETPDLHPTSANQREYRERLFGPSMWKTIHDLQQKPELKAIAELAPDERIARFYSLQAAADAYKGGEITEANLGVMFGLEDQEALMELVFSTEGGAITRKNDVEFAAANGEWSRTLVDLCRLFAPIAQMRHGVPEKGQIRRIDYTDALKAAVDAATRRKTPDPYITSIDIVDKFVDKARKKLINGVKADICAPPEEFLQATKLKPNSADHIYMNLAFDRLSDLYATFRNMRMLAKLDGSTKFLFGFYAPFSPETESFSKNENIPEFACFDPTRDLRRGWIGQNRSETIFRVIRDLNRLGFNTQRLAEHEYEVYMVHCISEPAGVLRDDPKYDFLRTYDFHDQQLNERRDAVFNGEIPDEEIVGFPERENVVLIAGNITMPEDGAAYEALDVVTEAGNRFIQVDPKILREHPKYAFLRNYDFGSFGLNQRRSKAFKGRSMSSQILLPYREDMDAVRKAFLKKSA